MKTVIFDQTKHFPNKVNFVDQNNVLVGYNLEQSCCELVSWAISETKDGLNPIFSGTNETEGGEFQIDDYCFDPSFFEREHKEEKYDENNAAIFKLVNFQGWGEEKKPDLYLRLENRHNGYYSHGFVFRGDIIVNDSI